MLTYGMKVIEDLVHPDQLVVQFIICSRVGQKGVSVRDKQVEYFHHLQHTQTIMLVGAVSKAYFTGTTTRIDFFWSVKLKQH